MLFSIISLKRPSSPEGLVLFKRPPCSPTLHWLCPVPPPPYDFLHSPVSTESSHSLSAISSVLLSAKGREGWRTEMSPPPPTHVIPELLLLQALPMSCDITLHVCACCTVWMLRWCRVQSIFMVFFPCTEGIIIVRFDSETPGCCASSDMWLARGASWQRPVVTHSCWGGGGPAHANRSTGELWWCHLIV